MLREPANPVRSVAVAFHRLLHHDRGEQLAGSFHVVLLVEEALAQIFVLPQRC